MNKRNVLFLEKKRRREQTSELPDDGRTTNEENEKKREELRPAGSMRPKEQQSRPPAQLLPRILNRANDAQNKLM